MALSTPERSTALTGRSAHLGELTGDQTGDEFGIDGSLAPSQPFHHEADKTRSATPRPRNLPSWTSPAGSDTLFLDRWVH
ncbi:MAG: hypothetical protein JWM76_2784 [Pseudonocardiales bacterium]|nr:hypothetical protein [Pseudonocardiales bacterium]